MILIHRLTPFVVGVLAVAGFLIASSNPEWTLWIMPLLFVIEGMLLARLTQANARRFESWVLIGTPLLLLMSAISVFLFLESSTLRMGLGAITGFFLYFYSENLFGFVHLPVLYQPHALQNLTMVLQVLGTFFFSAAAYAMLLFVPVIPLLALVVLFTPYIFLAICMSLWMGKAPHEIIRRYAIGGTVLFVELFVALSYFPTTFLLNAALLAIFLYLFLGMSRAQVQARLTRLLLRRYLGLGFGMLLLIVLSAEWT